MMTQLADPSAFPSVLCLAKGVIALAKPVGMNVFGDGSLAEWLISKRPALAKVGPVNKPALVHRLDQGTSGIMLAARDQDSYDYLRELFGSHHVKKWYLALVEGYVDDVTTVDLPLGGRYRRSARVWVDDGNKKLRGVRPAETYIEPLCASEAFSLCSVKIHTGMRHQIRAHLAYLGHPVAGDALYGAQKKPGASEGRFFLHARGLEFNMPGLAEPLRWTCPLPEDFDHLLSALDLSDRQNSDPEKNNP